MNDGPLIVQSDKTLLLEVDHARRRLPQGDRAVRRARAAPRAHPHLPADARSGCGTRAPPATTPSRSSTRCSRTAATPCPHALLVDVAETMARYGRLRLEKHPVHGLVLARNDRPVLEEVLRAKKVAGMLGERIDADTRRRAPLRARQPQAGAAQARLAGRGLRGLRRRRGARDRRSTRPTGTLRAYQQEAAESFWHGGSGVVVLPCGAGKTWSARPRWPRRKATTLILVTNTVSARQWKDELVRRTSLTEEEIGEYSGSVKEIRPVTIATYQVLTTRRKGVYTPPRAARRPRLGPDRLRRGAPAARADLPDDRRPAGAAPARPDRDPGARGRPRGRRVLA